MQKILFFLFPVLIYCQSVENKIEQILDNAPSSTKISILITNPNTRDTIFAKNINREMIPASNTKLFTTAAALYHMGPEYLLSFSIMTDDFDISDGTVDGNLYLKGFGNSLLTSKILDSLVADLHEQGIKEIKGDIVADDSFFDDIYTRDDWIVGEKANVNLPPVSAITIDRNKFAIKLYSNKPYGKPLGFSLVPSLSFGSVVMNATVSSKNRRPRINTKFTEDGYTVTVSRGIKKRKSPRGYAVFVDDPPQYIAFMMYDKLSEIGISVDGNPIKGYSPMINFELNSHSIVLKNLIKRINKNSDNFLAECLFKSLGAYFSDEQGNSFYATKAVNTFLDNNGIRDENTSLVDGSGISRFDVMSTTGVSSLLEYVYFNDVIFPVYFNSLSIAGVDGTLEHRMVRTKAYRNFRGKTGTLNGVSTISGYVTTNSGEDIIVTIFMSFNQHGANFYRNLQDKIIELVVDKL